MKKIVFLSTISLFAGCGTISSGQCSYSFEPASTEAITEMAMVWGSPELISIPEERDSITGQIISPARTEESKKKHPEELGDVTRIIKKPATYRILDEKQQTIKTIGEKEFVNFQKTHNCEPVKSQDAGS